MVVLNESHGDVLVNLLHCRKEFGRSDQFVLALGDTLKHAVRVSDCFVFLDCSSI